MERLQQATFLLEQNYGFRSIKAIENYISEKWADDYNTTIETNSNQELAKQLADDLGDMKHRSIVLNVTRCNTESMHFVVLLLSE